MPLGRDPDALRRAVQDFRENNLDPNYGQTLPYNDNYKEQCFQVWYQAGRPFGRQLLTLLPEDDKGRRPSWPVLRNWINLLGWRSRADELDREVKKQLDIQYAETRVEMMIRHAEVGKQMQQKGVEYLLDNPLDKSADAIRLVTEGVRIEKESVGIPEALEKVAKLKDTPLRELIAQLVSRLPDEDRLQLDTGITLEDEEDIIEDGEYVDEGLMPDDPDPDG